MAKLSKRAQVEVLGWTFTAIPRFHAAGTMWTNSQTDVGAGGVAL
jgi:hypothetical protein